MSQTGADTANNRGVQTPSTHQDVRPIHQMRSYATTWLYTRVADKLRDNAALDLPRCVLRQASAVVVVHVVEMPEAIGHRRRESQLFLGGQGVQVSAPSEFDSSDVRILEDAPVDLYVGEMIWTMDAFC